MRRRLFRFVAAGSLVLCMVTAGMWARSYQAGDSRQSYTYGFSHGGRTRHGLGIHSCSGVIIIESLEQWSDRPEAAAYFRAHRTVYAGRSDPRRLLSAIKASRRLTTIAGFGRCRRDWLPGDILVGTRRTYVMPYWVLTVVLALAPTAWVITRLHHWLHQLSGRPNRSRLQRGTPASFP